MIKRGFILYDDEKDTFKVDVDSTTSLIASEILLKEIIKTKKFAKGVLLDVGCGLEPYREVYIDRIDKYIGIDWPSSLHNNKGIVNAFCDNQILPFKENSFDTVLCTEVLEHSSNPENVIKEINRVLKKDGYLILSTPFLYWIHEQPWDYYRFTRFGLEYLVKKANFKIEYIKPRGGLFTVSGDVFSKFLLISAFHKIEIVSLTFQRVYLVSYFFIESILNKNRDKIIFKQIKNWLDNTAELFSVGYIMVARKGNLKKVSR